MGIEYFMFKVIAMTFMITIQYTAFWNIAKTTADIFLSKQAKQTVQWAIVSGFHTFLTYGKTTILTTVSPYPNTFNKSFKSCSVTVSSKETQICE